jgi:hypothetical protein
MEAAGLLVIGFLILVLTLARSWHSAFWSIR